MQRIDYILHPEIAVEEEKKLIQEATKDKRKKHQHTDKTRRAEEKEQLEELTAVTKGLIPEVRHAALQTLVKDKRRVNTRFITLETAIRFIRQATTAINAQKQIDEIRQTEFKERGELLIKIQEEFDKRNSQINQLQEILTNTKKENKEELRQKYETDSKKRKTSGTTETFGGGLGPITELKKTPQLSDFITKVYNIEGEEHNQNIENFLKWQEQNKQ